MKGIYKLYWEGDLVYIGKSLNIEDRIKAHKTAMEFDFDYHIAYEIAVEDLDIVESALIKAYHPLYNDRKRRRNKKDVVKRRIAKGQKFTRMDCQNCGERFKAFSLRAKYCSSDCRIDAYKKRKQQAADC